MCLCHRYEGSPLTTLLEGDDSGGQRIQRMVFAQTYIVCWMMLGTPLPHNDVARKHLLTSKLLHA